MADKRPALGKGLSALIPDVPEIRPGQLEVDPALLTTNPYQPRAQLDDARLDELTRSIRTNGVIQPIIVRKLGTGFEIIAGERRWRAAQRAGLARVPVIVRDVAPGSERDLLQIALIENIQRDDLNPIEQAAGFQRLADEFGMTQEQIAAAVGRDRASVANYLRLLKLPHEVRAAVAGGTLSMGHARALLALPDEAAQRNAARDVIARSLSVRETEALVRRQAEPAPTSTPAASPRVDANTRVAEEKLRLALGTRVQIVRRGAGGTIAIAFASEEELQRLYEWLTRR